MANKKRVNKETANKEKSDRLRKEGNELYNSKNFEKGTSCPSNPRSRLLKDSSGEDIPRCLEA